MALDDDPRFPSAPLLAAPVKRHLLLLVIAGGLACRSVPIRVPAYRLDARKPSQVLLAGRSRIDITPPPGYPMGGHSIAGRLARGYWTRLYARAFYFQDSQGGAVALVSCDLFAIPAGLQARVAYQLAPEGIHPSELILAATHTHHGPGNYLTSAVYNGFASLWGGFDKDLFDFLESRIAKAVTEAIEDARTHRLATTTLRLYRGTASHLVRNRATGSFVRNEDAEEILNSAPPASPSCAAPCARYRGVDPTLTVLEVRRKEEAAEQRVALLVFFAVHPTTMPHHASLYHSDLTGATMRGIERSSSQAGFVAGFFNGAEGDVSARWGHQGRADTLRLARRFQAGVETLLESPPIDSDSSSIETVGRSLSRKAFCAPGSRHPEFGVAALGGAEDGRTFLYDLGWQAGVTGPRRSDGHGIKQPALDLKELPWLRFTRLLSPASNYPQHVPIAIARLGPLALATLPVEMTTAAGRRVLKALIPLLQPRQIVLVGLANEYLSYVTTAEEYGAQDYEGASTIMGERSSLCFLEHLTALAQAAPASAREVNPVEFRAGPKPLRLRFGPALVPPFRGPDDEELTDPFAHDFLPSGGWPRFAWSEPATADWKTAQRRVVILEEHSGGWRERQDPDGPDDDEGSNLLTVLQSSDKHARQWLALWLPPREFGEMRFRFRVITADKRQLESPPFTVGTVGNP